MATASYLLHGDDLDQAGNPISAFLAACTVRAIDLGTPDEPHPHQVIPVRWRSINTALGTFVDELDAVEKRIKTDGAPVLAAYRSLLLPEHVEWTHD